jgi:hypothetical protein
MTRQGTGSVKRSKKFFKYPLIWLWEYPLIWLGILCLFVGIKFLLPHFPFLNRWEKHFITAAISIGRDNAPESAKNIQAWSDVPLLFGNDPQIDPEVLRFNGPVITQAWKCRPLKNDGACIRLIWKGESLLLAVTSHSKKFQKNKPDQTTSASAVSQGWGGVVLVKGNMAWVLVGPFTPDELRETWPFAKSFSPPKLTQ